MSLYQFHSFLWAMSGVALVVFVALYFVKAGYGMFRTASWGLSISNKLAWVLMEAPVFFVMAWLWGQSGVGCAMPQFLFFLLFELHYLQRSFVFPLLMKGHSRMPVAIMAMGIVFNVLNGFMQAGGIFWFPPEGYAEGWAWLLRPQSLLGLLVFVVGMGINLHSDHVIRHLRKPGDTKHYLPGRGLYRYVTSANYFGERASMKEEDQPLMTVSLKVDQDTKMGIVTDIKEALRKAYALKINYSAQPRQ